MLSTSSLCLLRHLSNKTQTIAHRNITTRQGKTSCCVSSRLLCLRPALMITNKFTIIVWLHLYLFNSYIDMITILQYVFTFYSNNRLIVKLKFDKSYFLPCCTVYLIKLVIIFMYTVLNFRKKVTVSYLPVFIHKILTNSSSVFNKQWNLDITVCYTKSF